MQIYARRHCTNAATRQDRQLEKAHEGKGGRKSKGHENTMTGTMAGDIPICPCMEFDKDTLILQTGMVVLHSTTTMPSSLRTSLDMAIVGHTRNKKWDTTSQQNQRKLQFPVKLCLQKLHLFIELNLVNHKFIS